MYCRFVNQDTAMLFKLLVKGCQRIKRKKEKGESGKNHVSISL